MYELNKKDYMFFPFLDLLPFFMQSHHVRNKYIATEEVCHRCKTLKGDYKMLTKTKVILGNYLYNP